MISVRSECSLLLVDLFFEREYCSRAVAIDFRERLLRPALSRFGSDLNAEVSSDRLNKL